MRRHWASVILQGPQQRVDVDLITGAGQEPAAVVIANVIAMRANRAIAVIDVFARGASFQDGVPNLDNSPRPPGPVMEFPSPVHRRRFPGSGAVAWDPRRGRTPAKPKNRPACEFSKITAQCAVTDGKRHRMWPVFKVPNPAAVIASGVA